MDRYEWKVHAQGGANVLFECDRVPGKLLRVRKPGVVSTLQVFEFYETHIKSAIGEFGLGMDIIQADENFIDWLQKNSNVSLKLDDSNVLVVDRADLHLHWFKMIKEQSTVKVLELPKRKITFCRMAGGSFSFIEYLWHAVVEIKPKWLLQSKDAPTNARFCRTCALHIKRHGCVPAFCPLDLASGDYERVNRAVRGIIEGTILTRGHDQPYDNEINELNELSQVISSFLLESKIISRLKAMQQLDKSGVLCSHENSLSNDFLVAMAARDCTMFIQVIDTKLPNISQIADGICITCRTTGNKYLVRAKIADFDYKDPHTKLRYWKGIESGLQEYYLDSKHRACEIQEESSGSIETDTN